MKFGRAISMLLREYDVDTVFGIPGVHTIELYRDIDSLGIRTIVPRHEQGAGFMADAYSRVSGRPGVCYLITGPGVLNAMTPIAQAWHDSIPMLVIASTTETADLGRGRGPLHDIPDQAGMLSSLCSISATVTDPDQFSELLADAYAGWRSGRPRPVHLAVPLDLLQRDVSPMQRIERSVAAPIPDRATLAAAAGLLASAFTPVIIAGGGALKGTAQLRTLAEQLDAPVVTTGNARGLLSPNHPLAVGSLLPFSSTQELIRSSDLVLAVGTEFSDTDVIYTGSRVRIEGQLIRIDIDPGQLNQPMPATVAIAADTGEACALLSAGLRTPRATGSGAARAKAARDGVQWSTQTESHRPWLDVLAAHTPPDTVVAIDSTQLAYSAQHYLPWSRPSSWLAPYGLGTLGTALPMAVGAKAAAPDRPVLAIAGDGGCLFTLTELATAADLRQQLTLILWDNGGYGEIRESFDRANITRVGTETSAHDLRAICAGFGAHAVRVDNPDDFGAALGNALQIEDRPSVIVVTEPGSPTDSTQGDLL